MRTTTNFEEFMSYVDWSELDINEKRALLDAARSTYDVNYGVFETKLLDSLDDRTALIYTLGDIELLLNIPSRAEFIRFLENEYMHGEDADCYISWIEEVEKDDDTGEPVTSATITMLPPEEWKVIKWIQIAVAGQRRIHFGTIAYSRNISDKYQMNPKHENDAMRPFRDYEEEEYPFDIIDDVILRAIDSVYKDAAHKSQLQIFDANVRDNNFFTKNRRNVTAHILITSTQPNVIDIPLHVFFIALSDKDLFDSLTMPIVVSDQEYKYITENINTIKSL